MINIIIAEDDKAALKEYVALLGMIPNINIVATATSLYGIRTALTENKPDVLLLDVELEDGISIDLVKELEKEDKIGFFIVFITAYHEKHYQKYMNDISPNFTIKWLRKPLNPMHLEELLGQINYLSTSNNKDELLYISTGKGVLRLKYSSIAFMIKDRERKNDLHIHLINGSKETIRESSILKMINHLPRTQFYKLSGSIIINKQYFHKATIENGEHLCYLHYGTYEEVLDVPQKKYKALTDEFSPR